MRNEKPRVVKEGISYYDIHKFKITNSYGKYLHQEEVWIVLCAAQPFQCLNPIYYAFLFKRQKLRNHTSCERPKWKSQIDNEK